jgi:hypothetical protein
MEETASSYCSGSPESKTTVFTPVLNSFDDCFTQVVDQYHYSSEGAPFKYGDGFETRQSSASASQFNKIDMGFTPYYHGITGHFAPCSELLPAEWTHNRPTLANIDDWSAAATRYLKLGNVDPSISKPLLLEYLLVRRSPFGNVDFHCLLTPVLLRRRETSSNTILRSCSLKECASLRILTSGMLLRHMLSYRRIKTGMFSTAPKPIILWYRAPLPIAEHQFY